MLLTRSTGSFQYSLSEHEENRSATQCCVCVCCAWRLRKHQKYDGLALELPVWLSRRPGHKQKKKKHKNRLSSVTLKSIIARFVLSGPAKSLPGWLWPGKHQPIGNKAHTHTLVPSQAIRGNDFHTQTTLTKLHNLLLNKAASPSYIFIVVDSVWLHIVMYAGGVFHRLAAWLADWLCCVCSSWVLSALVVCRGHIQIDQSIVVGHTHTAVTGDM